MSRKRKRRGGTKARRKSAFVKGYPSFFRREQDEGNPEGQDEGNFFSILRAELKKKKLGLSTSKTLLISLKQLHKNRPARYHRMRKVDTIYLEKSTGYRERACIIIA